MQCKNCQGVAVESRGRFHCENCGWFEVDNDGNWIPSTAPPPEIKPEPTGPIPPEPTGLIPPEPTGPIPPEPDLAENKTILSITFEDD